MQEDSQQPPLPPANSPGEVNVHLGYIRRDLFDIKVQNAKDLKDIKDQISSLTDHYVSQLEFNPIKDAVENKLITKEEFEPIKDTVEKKLVSKEEFEPIKKIVYGTVGLILVAFLSGLIALIIK